MGEGKGRKGAGGRSKSEGTGHEGAGERGVWTREAGKER